MNKIITGLLLVGLFIGQASASFIYQEIDPICSISGTTHTSSPGEISDTSSWNIPTAYEGECDETTVLTQEEKDNIYEIMNTFFESKGYYWSLYGNEDDLENGISAYATDSTLGVEGQRFMQNNFFPAVIQYISQERNKPEISTKNIAVLNYAVKTIWYDYYVRQPQ